jgi:hypothetical protein
LALLLSLTSLAACANGNDSDLASPQTQKWPVGPTTLDNKLLDEAIAGGVPANAATLAFNKYDEYSGLVKNTGYITIIDYTRVSGKSRMWMVNTKTGDVDALLVAHGSGSDPNNTGTPTRFSNVPDSKMTSLGAYLVSEKFQSSEHGTAMRLDGIEKSNSLARDRGILIHSAKYVSNTLTKMGMSWGCAAISLDWISKALSRLSGGSFMYAYGPPSSADADFIDEMQIQGIMTNPSYRWVNEGEEAPIEGVR